jgi:hypothetical protein
VISFLQRAVARAKAFARDDAGSKTVEFVWVLPGLVFIFFAAGEVGTLAARSVLLDRGLDIAIREVRLGGLPANATPEQAHDLIKEIVCENAFLLSSCRSDLRLSMVATPLDGSALPGGTATCIDRTPDAVQPAFEFNTGDRSQADDEIMLVRLCLPVDPIFPGTGIGAGLPKGPDGGYRIMLESAFLNEPI